jgi:integrase
MKIPNAVITDLYIKELKCPLGRAHQEVFDSELRGLYIDLLASGRKSFRVRYRFDKKLRVATLGDATLITADEARKLARELIRKGKLGLDPQEIIQTALGPKIKDFFLGKYMPYVKSYKRSWGTDLSMITNHIVTKLGELHMGSISPPNIAVFLETMRSQDYAPGTCNRALVLLRFGFELAIRWKTPGVEANPVKEIKNLRDDNRIERFLSNQQTIDLLNAVKQSESEMLQYIILFLIYTGARKREALDAKWQDIDWNKKSWRIPKTKSGKVRHIPLSRGALSVLEALENLCLEGKLGKHLKAFSLSDMSHRHIFANIRTGQPYVSFFYSWNAARIRAGMPDLRVHDLRHSFASFLVNAGRSLYEVQELLGHADIRTTSRYAHLSRERLIAAVEVVPLVAVEIRGSTAMAAQASAKNAVVVQDGSDGGQNHLTILEGSAQGVANFEFKGL